MFLIFDTETTGLPRNHNAPVSDLENWPRMVQLAWQLHDEIGQLIDVQNFIIKPEGYNIPFISQKIHGISTERAIRSGRDLEEVLQEFEKALNKAEVISGHNIEFDLKIIGAEMLRKDHNTQMWDLRVIDTKDASTDFCAIPGGKGGKFKWPSLEELHQKLFRESFDQAHNASADVEANARAFLELIRIGVLGPEDFGKEKEFIQKFKSANTTSFKPIGLNIKPNGEDETQELSQTETDLETSKVENKPFVHLHNHTQFSVLQAVGKPEKLVDLAKENGMSAVALTDSGNLMGAFSFNSYAIENGIKPLIGSEINVCQDLHNREYRDDGFRQLFLAKNKRGYINLAKLSSLSFTDGFYYLPRIDKEHLIQYKEDLIALTGGLFAEIPYLILNVGEKEAETAFVWWHKQFGDDFYVELSRHGLEEEKVVNETLLRFSKKYGVKYFASNNVYYPTREDAFAHDVLLCVKDNETVTTPKVFLGKKPRGHRFGFPNEEWYFKSSQEMSTLFADIPDALETTLEIADKCEAFELKRDVLLPAFDIPPEFIDPLDDLDGGKRGENAYLRHLAFEGAKKRYGTVDPELEKRLNFELETIANTGYPGYFLIVQDFTNKAREMGVWVGPGRGSAAGSVVAYVTGITNVDPIQYDLLFERFLNPDRISMPDIDIDFDDEGRSKVIDYVIEKYGSNQVAQIVTYGKMAAKSSIRDTARVLDLSLTEAGRLANLVPTFQSLEAVFGSDDTQLKERLRSREMQNVLELRKILEEDSERAKTLKQARELEGSLRNTGVHACGVIITPTDITDHIPIAIAKDSEMAVTQFDNSVVESAGLLKMDFLGLKTLSIIKDAVEIVKERYGVHIDPDGIPLDDQKTYELFQRGDTKGLFQFESTGMRTYLKQLKPDKFEDLIAMNALYRPGPMEYIPNFIARKHGKEEITYDLNAMEELLAETYGITVYQEQVMLLSQKLAGFTRGQADSLRKAMGKKRKAIIDQLKPLFIEGCTKNGHDPAISEKIWQDWEAFASYAFNKSHSTCYSVIAFQTGYLKAHYPAAYMASVLTHNLNDLKKVTEFMEECRHLGVPVLGPDVNESQMNFAVNEKEEIRFGLAAIKGIGESAVRALITERQQNGPFTSVFDFFRRMDLRSVNKKAIESLVLSGAFDSFGIEREQMFVPDEKERIFLETCLKYGHQYQSNKNSSQISLFGESSEIVLPEPNLPEGHKWPLIQKLKKEKEVVGLYISANPLDDFKPDIKSFCNIDIDRIQKSAPDILGKDLYFAGVVSSFEHRHSAKGDPYGRLVIEDHTGSIELMLFKEQYLRFKSFFAQDLFLYISAQMVHKPYRNPPEVLEIQQLELLNDVREKNAKCLSIDISLKNPLNGLLEELSAVFSQHPGKCKVRINFKDVDEKIKVETKSRSLRIYPSNELLEALDDEPNVKWELSKKG